MKLETLPVLGVKQEQQELLSNSEKLREKSHIFACPTVPQGFNNTRYQNKVTVKVTYDDNEMSIETLAF